MMFGRKLKRLGSTLTLAVTVFVGTDGWLKPQPVAAHHSYSTNYNPDNPRTVTGVIRAVRYASPHISMQLQTTGNPRQVWTIDLPSPPRAQQRGVTPGFLRVGSTATVVGWPARNGSSELGAVRVTIGEQTVQVR